MEALISRPPPRGRGPCRRVLPNMRLKLPGAYRSRGTGVLCAGAHELTLNDTARGGGVARSLSAIR